MVRTGRPKKVSNVQNRRHTIILSAQAETLFREQSLKRGNKKWLHTYINAHLVQDFGGGEEAELISELQRITKERNEKDAHIKALAARITSLREQRFERECDREIASLKAQNLP